MSDNIQHIRLAGRHGFKSYVDLEGEIDQLTAANRQLREENEGLRSLVADCSKYLKFEAPTELVMRAKK